MSNRFNLRLFGSPSITGEDGVALGGPAAQRHRLALLALLALAPAGTSSRDRLVGYLWPESEVDRARHLLKQAVYHLRRAFGDDAILSAGDDLRLNPEILTSDVALFEDALARGDPAEAVALFRGPLLDGFFLSDAAEFDRLIERERERLARAYAEALESLAHGEEAVGNVTAAVGWWRARAAQDPYDSRVALHLMQALEASGNRAGALQHATNHARLLQEEFGIRSAPEIEALADRLRRTRVAGAASGSAPESEHALPAAASVHPEPAGARSHVAPPAPDEALAGSAAMSSPADLAVDPPHPQAAGRRRAARARYAATALVAATLGASSFWFLGRDTDRRWFLDQAVPRIEKYLDVADWESAYALARQAERRVPDAPELAELWPRLSWRVTIESEPAGATVYRQRYDAPDDQWERLGPTPLDDIRIPYGLSRIRLELPGYRPLIRALGGAHLNWTHLTPTNVDVLLVGPETYRLDREETLPPDKVRVPGWTLSIGADTLRLRDFFLGRHEVTNAEYKAFVDAGGYRRADLWDPIVVKGDTVPFAAAMALFVDRTGRPAPSTWEAGDYPHGEGDFPVSGVSWYEAAAYARFVGQELSTAHHWQQALANAMFPWLLPASNFGGERARRVTDSRAMSHVGAYDMTGNVREWTASAIGEERIILGGSWNEPYYAAGTPDASAPPDDRSAGNGFRLALTGDEPAIAARIREPLAARTTVSPIERPPVSDVVYAAYSRVFDYDRGPLDPTIDAVDTTRVWIRERVQFAAGYGAERMLLHLYLPTAGTPPYQTVVYWPGWDTFALDDADEYFAKLVDFIVKSGRAVAFPIYRGTFERRVGDVRRRPEFGSAEYRDNTIETVKDLRRTIDYLETRSDIDHDAIAFFGYSWGGVNGPAAMAQEPRIRVAVINIGLLPPMAATPEVDPVNALPRVRVPTLMFSGEFDPMVPTRNSQRYFALLGTPADRKRHVVAIGGHFIPRHLLIGETLEWLDTHLGRVSR